MADEKPTADLMPYVENLSAPEYFVSGLAGWSADGDNLRLTFVNHRVNHDRRIPLGSQQALVVTLRVVMSRQEAFAMCETLGLVGKLPPDGPSHGSAMH